MELSKLVELMVYQGSLSRNLFKYRKINEKFNKIIEESGLYLSSPLMFNDPFDCHIVVDTNNTYEEIKNYLTDADTKKLLTQELIEKHALFLFFNPRELKELVNSNVTKVLERKGISCFGNSPDNVLMWSHYTDGHTGVCLKFDVLKDTEFFQSLSMLFTNLIIQNLIISKVLIPQKQSIR